MGILHCQHLTQNQASSVGFEMRPWAQVTGDALGVVEPRWDRMSRMTYAELYAGLRRRNWTSEHYDPAAEPWSLTFYEDTGRTASTSWPGCFP